MYYSVDDFIKKTGEKKGTVELFRAMLRKGGLITDREKLNEFHLTLFEKLKSYKMLTGATWENSMVTIIQEEKSKDFAEIKIDKNIILQDLIWQINNDKVSVNGELSIKKNPVFWHVVFDIIIDNFTVLGFYKEQFADSAGSDGNGVLTFEIKGKDFIYYMVGKYNHQSRKEEVHVFYNEGDYPNAVRLKYISGGTADEDNIYDQLWHAAKNNLPN